MQGEDLEQNISRVKCLTFLPTIDFNRGFSFLVLDLMFLLIDLTSFKSDIENDSDIKRIEANVV